MAVMDFLLDYKWIIIFYSAVLFFLFLNRKKVVTQAKIIVLYRTVFGIRFIEWFSERFREPVKIFGLSGIGAGFVGMLIISFFLIINFIMLFFREEAASGVTLVLPGLDIPGVGILPFWHWLLAIFIIALVHEFSHGIVAHAHNLKVKFTGLVFFGPIIGAFVEPDEKKLLDSPDVVQYSVYAAGAFSNIILAFIALFLLSAVFVPIEQSMVEPAGFTFTSYYDSGYPAQQSGLVPGEIISSVDGNTISSFADFQQYLQCVKPGSVLSITADGNQINTTPVSHPEESSRAFIGISGVRNEFLLKDEPLGFVHNIVLVIIEFLRWLYILSFGIGLFNLLPLPVVDGGRMVQTFLKRLYGEDAGNRRYGKVGIFFLALLILSFVAPLFF